MADSMVRPEEEEVVKEDQISDMKSEETRVKKEKVAEKSSTPTKSIWDCGSPLYDSYELVSVIHVIERHWMIFPFQAASSSKNCSSRHEMSRKSMSSSSSTPKNTVINKIMTMKTTSNNMIGTGDGEARKKNKTKTTTSGFARFFCCFCKNYNIHRSYSS